MLSPRIPKASRLPVQECMQAHMGKDMKMEEDNENGEFLHAVELRDYIYCLYCSSNSNESLFKQEPNDSCSNCLFYREYDGTREKVSEYAQNFND